MQGVWPVFIVVRTDPYIIDGGDLLGWKAAHAHAMLGWGQGNKVCQATIITSLAAKDSEQSVVKPPAQKLQLIEGAGKGPG